MRSESWQQSQSSSRWVERHVATKMRRSIAAATLALAWLGSASVAVHAQDAPARAAKQEDDAATRAGAAKPEATKVEAPKYLPDASIATSLPPYLADPFGIRSALFDKGIKFNLLYIGEAFGNPTGGKRQGAIYEGRLQLLIDVDLEKAVGWKGGAIHIDGQQIHGTGLSRYYVGNLNATSNIEALASTRLYEAYFEQQLIDGKLSVRAGQLAADTQYAITTYGSLFINSTFGFPQFGASNLPGGGPAFPLATPGAGAKFTPTDNLTFLATIYNGDPANPNANDPQKANRHGVDFRLQDPPTIFAEAQYKYNTEKGSPYLPGTVKIGFFNNFSRFPDGLFFAVNPALLAGRRDDQAIYGVVDQQIYRLSADAPDKGVGVFLRASASPTDRSVVDFYLDGGLNFSGLVPGRPDDTFGAAFAYSHISEAARQQDASTPTTLGPSLASMLTPGRLIRNYEATFELSYQAQVVPGFTVQPDFQYSVHPGANAANPYDQGRPIRDAAVFGVRAAVSY